MTSAVRLNLTVQSVAAQSGRSAFSAAAVALLISCTTPTVTANLAPAPAPEGQTPTTAAPESIPEPEPPPPEPIPEPPPPEPIPEPPPPEPIPEPPPPEPPVLVAPESTGPVRVALLLPLSGPEKELGRSMLDAATMALFEVGGENLILMPRDTLGVADKARMAAEAALQEGAELILGPVFSASVRAAADAVRSRNVNMVAFSTDATVAGNGVHLLAFMPQQQVSRVVSFAASQGLLRFAALAPETPYGIAVVDALRLSAKDAGGELANIEFYPAGANDAMEAARRLADYDFRSEQLVLLRRALTEAGDTQTLEELEGRDTLGDPSFEAVMLPEGGRSLRQVAPLLPFFDVDPTQVQFLGTGMWDDATLGNEPALVGGWYAAPPPEAAARFTEQFAATYGYLPPRIATLAYDAVALAAALSRGKNPDFSRAAIANPSGFAGTDGIFRFLDNGIVDRGLAVLKITADGPVVIDPAPVTFQRVTN